MSETRFQPFLDLIMLKIIPNNFYMLLYLEYAYSTLYRDVNFLNLKIVLLASLIWNNSVLSKISKLTFMADFFSKSAHKYQVRYLSVIIYNNDTVCIKFQLF